MTVQSTLSFIDYVGDGVTLSFNFTFRADDVAWVLVDFTDDFDTVTLNVDQDANPGGSVSYLIAPPALQPIRIQRNTPIDQQLDLQRYDPFDSESNEDTYDKLTMMIQDGVDALSNLVAPVTLEGSLLRGDILSGQWVEFGPGVGEFILPPGDGAPGQFLFTDGLGQLGFANIASGSLAGSVDGAILRYNLAGNEYQEFTAYLLPAVDGAAGEVLTTDGAGNITFQPGGDIGIDTFAYQFSTSTAQADPGSGFLRFNSATPAFVTRIFISDLDFGGFNLDPDVLSNITDGYRLRIRDPDDLSVDLVYGVAATQNDQGGWWNIDIAHISGSVMPSNNTNIEIEIRAESNVAVGASFTAGSIMLWDTNTYSWVISNGEPSIVEAGGATTFDSGNSVLILESSSRVQTARTFYAGYISNVDALIMGADSGHYSIGTGQSSNRNLDLWADNGGQAVRVKGGSTFMIEERSGALGDITAYGQFWVRDEAPNIPMFTADAGGVGQVLDPSVSEINTQNGNYTLVISDKGKTIYKASGGAGETITIPANGSVAFRIGTLISIDNDGGDDLTIAITSDNLIGTNGAAGSKTLGDNHTAVIEKLTATRWRYMASDL